MFVGICKIELLIPGCSSLKEKRMVVQSIKEKIYRRFKVSVAEVDHLDKWQRVGLGIAKVSNNSTGIEQTFSHIDNFIESDVRIQILDWNQQII